MRKQVAELADANMALRVGAGRAEQLLAQTRRAMELRNAEILRLREAQLPAGCLVPPALPGGHSGSTPQLHSRAVHGDRAGRLAEPDQVVEPKQARQLRAALAASEVQRARDGASHRAELAALHSAHSKQILDLQGSPANAHAKGESRSAQRQQQQPGCGPRTPETGGAWRRPVLSLSSEEAAPLETCACAPPGRAAAVDALHAGYDTRWDAGGQLWRVAELERQVLTWRQRCRELEEQLSALHHALEQRSLGTCMPGAQVLQEGFVEKEVPYFPLHEFVSPGALEGALLGASASWRRVTAPTVQAACQAAWAAPDVHEVQVIEDQPNGHESHSLVWRNGCILPAIQIGQDTGSTGVLWGACAQGSASAPYAQQHRQWERNPLNPQPCPSEDGSSLFSIGEPCTAMHQNENSAEDDAHMSLLLQALEAAVAPSGPAHERQQPEPQAALPRAQEESAPVKAPTSLQEASVALAPR